MQNGVRGSGWAHGRVEHCHRNPSGQPGGFCSAGSQCGLPADKLAHEKRKIGALGCRIASGDQDGRVVVWDIATGTPVISLEDPVQAASGARGSTPGKGGAVKGLAWVMANPARLAIVLAGGMVLVWDVQGEY